MKKRLLSILLVAAMVVAMVPAMVFATSAGTDVTVTNWSADEIVLMNAADFVEFRKQIISRAVNKVAFVNQTVKLGADIDLNGVTLAQLDANQGFCGTFDGQNHVIKNISYSGSGYNGLFGAIPQNVDAPIVLKNFAIVNATFTATVRASMLYSAAYSDTSFENVYINAVVKSSTNGDRSGGFVGYVWDSTVTFTNCVFDGTVTNTSGNGAFVGSMRAGSGAAKDGVVSLTNCLANSSSNFVGIDETNGKKGPTLTNCIKYDAATVGEGLAAQTYLDANNLTDWTALDEGYPVPTTIASAFFETIKVINWDADEIVLMNADDFVAFRQQIITKGKTAFVNQTVKLGADIDLNGVALAQTDANQGFCGTFDGQNHVIKNISYSGGGYNGLFGAIPQNVDAPIVLKNFAIVNATFTGSVRASMLYSAAYSDTIFENVYVNAVVTSNNNGDRSGGFVGYVWDSTVTFTNCVFDGTVNNTSAAGAFVGSMRAASGTGKDGAVSLTNCLANSEQAFIGIVETSNGVGATITNCIKYDAATVGEGLNSNAPEGFTARNESYPVPTTLLPFFTDTINAAHTTQAGAAELVVEYSTAQEKYENGELSVRLIGAMNLEEGKTLADYTAIGFEVVAIRQENGELWNNGATEITNVYTSYLNNEETVTAEAAGGDYVFVYALDGIQPNKGIVTFAIKTFYVDAEGETTYTDMYVLDYDTAYTVA